MALRARIYDIVSLILIAGSIWFFYRSVAFLTVNEYVGSVVTMLIGLVIIRVGVELARIALASATEPRT